MCPDEPTRATGEANQWPSAGPSRDGSGRDGGSNPDASPTAASGTREGESSRDQPGTQVGPYKLLSILGEGGFGTVWLAERREPMVQRVALKIIKPGMDSKAVVARFEQERQALAVMDHPNVARVFDGGVTDAGARGGGRPYFVMELVQGEPLNTFCDRHQLTIRERLELFIPICEAVQHAHSKGIVHRDIKPSNILVSMKDGHAVPKVIDFGIAKAITHEAWGHTAFTQQGTVIGTSEYMSPEQISGALDIDTRSDVYSLGVVLYEVLVGALPFDAATLRSASFVEVQRIIREVDPPRPSTRLSGVDHRTGEGIASARRVERERLASELKRELEWIPLKAMRKERVRRYASADAMGADIRRYLDGRPLEAAPESRAYLFKKFVRRHRVETIAAAAVFLALIAGLAGTISQAREASLQRDAALAAQTGETEQRKLAESQREEALRQKSAAETNATAAEAARARAQAITDFVTTALRSSDPFAVSGNGSGAGSGGGGGAVGGRHDTTILGAMELALRDLDAGRFKDDPETEAALRSTIATILENNGRAREAEPLYRAALETYRARYPGDHPLVANALHSLSRNLHTLGRPEAEPMCRESLAMYERLTPRDEGAIARGLSALGLMLADLGRASDGVAPLTESLRIREQLHSNDNGGDNGRDSAEVAISLSNLASVLRAAGRAEEASPLAARALEMRERLYKGDHPDVANSLDTLAMIELTLGRLPEAETLYTRALEMRTRLFPGDHPTIAENLNMVAWVREDMDRAEEAGSLYQRALDMRRRLFPGNHPEVAASIGNLGYNRQALGMYEEARALFIEADAMYRAVYPGDHPSIATNLSNLAMALNNLGEQEEATRIGAEALAMRQRLYPSDHPDVSESLNNLAVIYNGRGMPAEAEPLYRQAMEMSQRLYTGDHPGTAMSLSNLATVRLNLGRASDAASLYAESLDMYRRLYGDDNPRVTNAITNLARAQQAQGMTEAARANFDDAIRRLRAANPEGSGGLARVLWRSGVARMESNELDAALRDLEESVALSEKFIPADHPHLAEHRASLEACRAAMGK